MNTHSHYLGGRRALTRLQAGMKMIVDTDDLSITPHILLDGVWAPQIDAVLARKVVKGDKCLDIGCHYGYTALMLAALSAERVVCVDMNSKMTDLCKQNLDINGFKNHVLNFAIVARDEKPQSFVRYIDMPHESGGNHLTTDANSEHHLLVESITVRELILSEGDFDFIKIDTEGMDWYIFDKLTEETRVKKCLLEHRPVDAESHANADYVERAWQNCVRRAFETHDVYVVDAKGVLHVIANAQMLLDEEGVTHMDLYLESKS